MPAPTSRQSSLGTRPGLLALLLLCGCVTGPDLSRIKPGMTADQVVAKLGRPYARERQGNVELIKYETEASAWDMRAGGAFSVVRLVDGKVTDYGRAGEIVITNSPSLTHSP